MNVLHAPRISVPAFVLALCSTLGLPALAHDGYPTADRVHYVQECMRQHPGPNFEMVSKCSCTLDKISSQLPYDEFVLMTTASKANSIGGERGNQLRDTESLQVQVRKFRQLQSASKKSCFIFSDPVNP